MPAYMKAYEFTRKGFVIRDMPRPSCGPHDVLVETVACGVCGGEVLAYKHRAELDTPSVFGHEGSGVVAEVGSKVEGFRPGDKVTALGGGYAEYFLSKPGYLLKLPENVPPKWALGEPVSCCVHACNRLRISKTARVAVVGCGFMGLVCLQLVKQRGARSICAIDPIVWRLATARDLGADAVCTPQEAPVCENPGFTGNFDVVIEAAGTQSAIDLCGDLVAQHGQVNLVGYHQSNRGLRTVNMQQWNFKAIDVINGHVRRDDEKFEAMRQGVALVGEGLLRLEPLVQHYPFSRIEEAFRDVVNHKEGLFKIVLVPDGLTIHASNKLDAGDAPHRA